MSAMRELLDRCRCVYTRCGYQVSMFSVALVPTCANIHVHWAQVRDDGKLIYHMHLVDSYAIRKDPQSLLLSNKLNNILDWITLTRKPRIKKVLTDIGARTKLDCQVN